MPDGRDRLVQYPPCQRSCRALLVELEVAMLTALVIQPPYSVSIAKPWAIMPTSALRPRFGLEDPRPHAPGVA